MNSLLLPLLAMSSICATAQHESFAWREFNLAFGEDKMMSSVGTVEQLSLAVQHQAEISTTQAEPVATLACAPYDAGAQVAASVRAMQDCDMWMTPLFVGQDDDLICFIARIPSGKELPANIVAKLTVYVTIPSQLKIEPDVIGLIDALATNSVDNFFGLEGGEYPANIYLAISCYSNSSALSEQSSFNSSFGRFDDEEYVERMDDRRTNLESYSLSSVQTFFWSEENVAGGSYNNTVSANIRQWDRYYSLLDSEHEEASTTRSVNDICDFKSLDYSRANGDVLIPLMPYFDFQDVNQASACLAFIISEFASDSVVSHIAITTPPQLLNYMARSIQQSGHVGVSEDYNPYTAAGLTGEDQVVGVADTGLDEQSCYFYDPSGTVARTLIDKAETDMSRRKVVQYSFLKQADEGDLTAGHGTHVAGTVAGYNREPLGGDGRYSGIAPLAKIAFLDIAADSGSLYIPPVSSHYPTLKTAFAYICSNSWGGSFSKEGYYAGARIDKYLYKNMDTVILFANGNAGEKGLGTVSREACSKNVVSVGASENNEKGIDNVAYFSSLGPTYDGRIKPDIVAPGAGLTSARAAQQSSNDKTCATTSKQGTSMATPAAAGIAALMRQYFRDKEGKFWTKTCYPTSDKYCNAFTPSGMLLKALLIHSGEKMNLYHYGNSDRDVKLSQNGKPDVYQGFGRVQLSNVLPLPGKSNFQLTVRDMVELQEGTTMTHYFKVKDSSQPLVATLSWYDPPADKKAAKALVNDLDLVLKQPNGKTLYGNFKKKRDHVNNNERISINKPSEGVYSLSVEAKALPVAGRQRFALVLTYGGTPIDATNQQLRSPAESGILEGVEGQHTVSEVGRRKVALLNRVATAIGHVFRQFRWL